jgi:hypothetical protein
MIPEQIGQELHDRDTRGVPLISEERAQLEEWYHQQDAAESNSISQSEGGFSLAALRAGVEQALEQLKATAQEIQVLAATNERLREEIISLRQRLAQRPLPQSL